MKKEISLIVAIFLCLFFVFNALVIDFYEKQENAFLKKEQEQMNIVYNATSNANQLSFKTIIKERIIKDDVLEILSHANFADELEKSKLRTLMYRKFYNFYNQDLIESNVLQFQFHLKNGTSFLRFYEPSFSDDSLIDFRPTIRKANIEKKYSSGFEQGHIAPGFRHVFPLTYQNKHIGSVELSMNFEALETSMRKLLSNMQLMLIMKKSITTDVVNQAHKARFSEAFISDKYVIENPRISKLNNRNFSSKIINSTIEILKQEPTFKIKIQEKLTLAKPFSEILWNKTEVYGIHFLPIFDTSNKLAAYVLGFKTHNIIKDLKAQEITMQTFGSFGILILAFISYLLAKNRKQTISQKNELEVIADTIQSGLFVMDKNGKLVFTNQIACELLEYDKDEILNTVIHGRIHFHEHNTECNIIKVAKTGVAYAGEETFIKKNGKMFPVHVSSGALKEDGKTTGSVTIFRDITKEKHAHEQVRRLAYYDTLTDLPNRKFFFDKLEETISENKNSNIYRGILYIDLDDFKVINDTCGHQIGDKFLVQFATKISSNIRQDDIFARLGGDEFVVIINPLDLDLEIAKNVFKIIIEKFYLALEEPFVYNKQEFFCKASMGGIIFKSSKSEATELLRKADTIMYKSKNMGKNTYTIELY